MSQGDPTSFPNSAFSMVSNIGALTPVAAAAILFGTTEAALGSKIAYDAATGIWTLQGGGVYELQAGCNTGTFSGATGLFAFRWRDITNNLLLGAQGHAATPTSAAHVSQNGPATAAIRAVTALTIRCEAITTTAFTSVANSWATVRNVRD